MNYAEALRYLDQHRNLEATEPLGAGSSGVSLDSIAKLLAAVGDPQDSYPVIHVSGTNGKGSVTRFTADILAGLELAVGRYTSPHLHRINERISYDGVAISDDELARVVSLLAEVEPLVDAELTWFELVTATALVWFADQGIDVAVVEVGMLGADDATNVVQADVAVINNVARDHVPAGADDWLLAVAEAKSGIITPGRPLVLGEVPTPEVRAIFDLAGPAETMAVGRDALIEANTVAVGGRVLDYVGPHGPYEPIFVPFHGAHQVDNAATALLTVETFLNRGIDGDFVAQALSGSELPGRFELIALEPKVIVDVAHNEAAAEALWSSLNEEFARLGSWILVVGTTADRDTAAFLRAIHADQFDAVICTEPGGPRSLPAADLGQVADSMGIAAEVVADPVEAALRARAVASVDDCIVVTGASGVVAAVRATINAAAD